MFKASKLIGGLFYRVGEGTDKSLSGIPGQHNNNMIHKNINMDLTVNGGHQELGRLRLRCHFKKFKNLQSHI